MSIPRFQNVPDINKSGMTFENYLKQIHLLYPNLELTYEKYMDKVDNFYEQEFNRFLNIDFTDVQLNNENYQLYFQKINNRLQRSFDIFTTNYIDNQLIDVLDNNQLMQMQYEFYDVLFNKMFYAEYDRYSQNDADQLKIMILLHRMIAYKLNQFTQMFYAGNDGYDNDFINQLVLNNQDEFSGVHYDSLGYANDYMKYILNNYDVLKNVVSSQGVGVYNAFANSAIDSTLGTIINKLQTDSSFQLDDKLMYLFEYICGQAIFKLIYLLDQDDKLSITHKNTVFDLLNRGIGQNFFAIQEYGTRKGFTGANKFASYFNQINGHVNGQDDFGVQGGVMCTSDSAIHARFIATNWFRLVQGSDESTITQAMQHEQITSMLTYFKSGVPTAFEALKNQINSI